MKPLIIVGLVLGVTFGCLLILLVAEVCYFLCWKKRTSHADSEKDTNFTGKDLFQMFCEERSGFNDDDPEGQVQTQNCRYYSQSSPRFLFTIEEGMKEGCSESESVNTKSSCRVSPCDSFINVETPYFTPLNSTSPCLPSPITHPLSLNPPHFESANDDSVKFNRVKSSNQPTRLKLLPHIEEAKPS